MIWIILVLYIIGAQTTAMWLLDNVYIRHFDRVEWLVLIACIVLWPIHSVCCMCSDIYRSIRY